MSHRPLVTVALGERSGDPGLSSAECNERAAAFSSALSVLENFVHRETLFKSQVSVAQAELEYWRGLAMAASAREASSLEGGACAEQARARLELPAAATATPPAFASGVALPAGGATAESATSAPGVASPPALDVTPYLDEAGNEPEWVLRYSRLAASLSRLRDMPVHDQLALIPPLRKDIASMLMNDPVLVAKCCMLVQLDIDSMLVAAMRENIITRAEVVDSVCALMILMCLALKPALVAPNLRDAMDTFWGRAHATVATVGKLLQAASPTDDEYAALKQWLLCLPYGFFYARPVLLRDAASVVAAEDMLQALVPLFTHHESKVANAACRFVAELFEAVSELGYASCYCFDVLWPRQTHAAAVETILLELEAGREAKEPFCWMLFLIRFVRFNDSAAVDRAIRVAARCLRTYASNLLVIDAAVDSLAYLCLWGPHLMAQVYRAGALTPALHECALRNDAALVLEHRLLDEEASAAAAADAAMAALLAEEESGAADAAAKSTKSKKKKKGRAATAGNAASAPPPASAAAAAPPPAAAAPPPAAVAPAAAPAPAPAAPRPANLLAAALAAPRAPPPPAAAVLPPLPAAATPPPAPQPTLAAAAPASGSARECCVCLDDVALASMHLLVPCGHRCVCGACAAALLAAPPAARLCPKCRAAVAASTLVYDE